MSSTPPNVNPANLFSENQPTAIHAPRPETLAPKRPDGEADPLIQEIKQRAAESIGLADKIRAAKRSKLLPFYLTRTVPGESIEVKVQRPSMLWLATSGRLPVKLQAVIGKMFSDETLAGTDPTNDIMKIMQQDMSLLQDMLHATAIAGFVDPPLTPSGVAVPDGALSVDEIDIEDLLAFFSWCNETEDSTSEALAEFPEAGPAAPVEDRPDGEAIRSATFGNPEDGSGGDRAVDPA